VKGPVDLSSPASIYGKIRDTIHHGVEHMVQKKEIMDKLSIYIPQPKMAEKPVERPIKLGAREIGRSTIWSWRRLPGTSVARKIRDPNRAHQLRLPCGSHPFTRLGGWETSSGRSMSDTKKARRAAFSLRLSF